MRRFFLAMLAATVLFFGAGCGNLSPQANPKLDQKIDNQQGKIGEISNMQNSMRAEIGNLKSQSEIQNSKLDRIQQGLLNLQQNNDNHGVQILSGPGGLTVGLVVIVTLIVVIFYYRNNAKMHEKTANILAERIIRFQNTELENAVFESVLHQSDVAPNMLSIFKKHKALMTQPELPTQQNFQEPEHSQATEQPQH